MVWGCDQASVIPSTDGGWKTPQRVRGCSHPAHADATDELAQPVRSLGSGRVRAPWRIREGQSTVEGQSTIGEME